ncbi:ubiquitin-associated protein 1 isoform X2 [Anabrus simplex]
MDGVSVKIAENFKPPRKIALSVGFQHRFPVESGAEEYDFKLEHSVLSKMGEWRKLRQAEVAARKERIKAQDAAWEERFSKQLQNFALGPSSTEAASTVGSSSKTYSSPTVSSTLSQNVVYPSTSVAYCSSSLSVISPTVTYSNPSMAHSSNNVVYSHPSMIAEQNQHCLPNSILTPVPISHAVNEINATETFSQFNFSDFEADTSSPFDNMELKTINDMEELAHVLQPPDSNKNEPSNSNLTLSNNYSSTTPYNVNQTVTYFNTIGYKPSKESVTPCHINGYSSYGTEPRAKDQRSRNENYINLTEYSTNIQDLRNSYYYRDQSWNVDNVCHSTTAGNIKSEIIGDQSVERPNYATLPLSTGLSFPSTYNQHSSSNQDQDVPSRSLSRSVPDIVEELEKELTEKKIADTNAVAARASHTPPPRPNSFGSTGLENWKPWPDLDSPEQSQSKGKKSPVKKLPVSSLPNPFHKLSPEGQQLTRHISEMGFALPRVARACVALHEDGKKVVEFLLQVQSLEETWPGDQAENALLLNECDYPRAVKYLEALTQLLDLGFPEDKVSQALVMFNNDRDKALDHIIS